MAPDLDHPQWTRLLLDVWRQVSEHLDIGACAEGLWSRLRAEIPAHRLWVRRLDPAQSTLETVAVSPWGADLTRRPVVRTLDTRELAALVHWVGQEALEPAPPRIRRIVLPSEQERADLGLLAGGLVDQGAPVGVLLLEVEPGAEAHCAPLRELLAPLVVALRNDRRVHELARLREAVEAENRALLTRLARDGIAGSLVGADGGMREVMAMVQQVSQTDTPVLILGETGTGKELVAREIHSRSRRSRGPFLKVNCGAIPAELVDSELFGHERGSFTGAVSERRGWFERADGGTLFLDEIGELPHAAQVRLLRVLQDGTFERVGGQRPLHADVRIVAATHRDLREMVSDGRFRGDLWYRIGVFPLVLPALRERMGDLPALVATFAARAGQRLFGRPLEPQPQDLNLLASYHWPGNVRELSSVIERAAILGDGHGLDVPAALGIQASSAPGRQLPGPRPTAEPPPGVAGPPPGAGSTGRSSQTLEEVNRRAIEAALSAAAGRIEGRGGAAARLGLSPSTLRSRMKRLGIVWERFRVEGQDGR